MDNDAEYLKKLMLENKIKISPLIKYLPWLKEATDKAVSSMYRGEGSEQGSILAFPVYDSTLMSFIKDAEKTQLMDRNYPYVYSRRMIKSPADERKLIMAADYKSWDALCGILSHYVLGGRTKAVLWSQGVSEQIFYLVVEKLNDIVNFWLSENNGTV